MKTIILKLDNNFVYLNNELAIDYQHTDLPKTYFSFDTSRPIYFEAEQLNYDKDSKILSIKIINYRSTKIKEFELQNPRLPVEWLEFDKMDWEKFEPLVYSYVVERIKHCFVNASKLFNIPEAGLGSDLESLRKTAPNLFFQKNREPVIENIKVDVPIKFEVAKFHDGKIGFTAKLKEYTITTDLFIENEYLKEEFEYIKPWIVKKIGKKFLTSIRIKLVDGQIEEATADSDEIAGINADLIESIRIMRVVEFHKKATEEKVLYSNDDVLSVVNESNSETNVLKASASDILEIMVKQGMVRNVRQLEFLSKDKQSLNDKLRFTGKPHFGFVFKVDNAAKQFFIWELLNTHATYVWERDMNENGFKEFIENEISLIKANGREEYRRYYKNLEEKDFTFHLIEHEGADLSEEERFVKWREKVEAIVSKN